MSVRTHVLTPPVEGSRPRMRRTLAVSFVAFVALSSGRAFATSAGQPFPSNLYTQPDPTQITGLHIDLPMPNCATNPSDCADVAVLDTLDGFNLQPRISVPFSGPIDLSSVSSSTIYLVGAGRQIGINRIVWEPAANTLHFTSDELLAQDTAYLLVVTRGVLDASGAPVDELNFRRDWNYGQTKDEKLKRYRKSVLDALPSMLVSDVEKLGIVDLSLFTTQSVDSISRTIRSQLPGGAANFNRGTHGERTVFPRASILGIQFTRQTGTAPVFSTSFLPTPALNVIPGSVGTVAFGSYASPDYENADRVIPAVGTLTGTPVAQSTNELEFTLFVPAGATPAGGWPVAIFGHGFTDSKEGAPWTVASSFAARGIATIAINVVGHGGGALGTYAVLRAATPPVVLPSGGRGIDHDGNGRIDSTEGVFATGAVSLIGPRDGLRQTVIDLMQLVRVLQGGVDVDGDGTPDLSTSRIYYAGQSFGGIYGVQFLGLEPDVRAGVPNVAGGSLAEATRLGGNRPLVGVALLTRVPDLYNAVPNASFTNFIENLPLRNLPTVVDTVPGASAIQASLDNTEWAQQAANPVAYASLITQPVIIQFARGDETVPNPTTSAILRAGGLAPRATLFRNDLAYAANPAVGKNPHTFLTNITNPAAAAYAIGAQAQIAVFFASDGTITIDPDGAGPFFEVPTSMVPEDLAFIP